MFFVIDAYVFVEVTINVDLKVLLGESEEKMHFVFEKGSRPYSNMVKLVSFSHPPWIFPTYIFLAPPLYIKTISVFAMPSPS